MIKKVNSLSRQELAGQFCGSKQINSQIMNKIT